MINLSEKSSDNRKTINKSSDKIEASLNNRDNFLYKLNKQWLLNKTVKSN